MELNGSLYCRVYVLCAQVEPDITPELFYEAAWETATGILALSA